MSRSSRNWRVDGAASRLQKKVQEFITTSAQRRVLIEATIAEVQLSGSSFSQVSIGPRCRKEMPFVFELSQSVIGSNLTGTAYPADFNIANRESVFRHLYLDGENVGNLRQKPR